MSGKSKKTDSRTHISLFHYNKLNTGAGEERAILNYARNLDRKRFDVTIYQTDYCRIQNLTDYEVSDYLNGLKLVTLRSIMTPFRIRDVLASDAGRTSKLLAKGFSLFLKVFLMGIFSRIANRKQTALVDKSDIVYTYDAEYSAYIPKVPGNIPIIGTFRRDFGENKNQDGKPSGNSLSQILIEIIYAFVVRRITAFHFLTQRLFDHSPIHREKDFIQHSGVDLKIFHPPEEERSGKLKFLFVARLERVKGITETVEAFEKINHKDTELHIAGTGTMQDYVEGKASSSSSIFYDGFLSGEELTELYRKCDVFVFPTKMSEQHPLVVVEAVASGLTVITSSNLRGIFDNFEEKGYLEYVDPNVEAVKETMKKYVDKKDSLRKETSEIASSAAEYDWAVITDKLFDKLKEFSSHS